MVKLITIRIWGVSLLKKLRGRKRRGLFIRDGFRGWRGRLVRRRREWMRGWRGIIVVRLGIGRGLL